MQTTNHLFMVMAVLAFLSVSQSSVAQQEEALIQSKTSAGDLTFEQGLAALRRGDYQLALSVFQHLALSGNAYAQINLGGMYRRGQGVTQDYAAATSWYRLAADQGNAHGQSLLGDMHGLGLGVPQDYAAAISWYRLAAEQGNAHGQSQLGRMYYLGRGVLKDLVQAHLWLNLGAVSGNEDSIRTRDAIATQMTQAQLIEAQRLAHEWRKNGE
jgi:uncharacterized protein